MGRYNRRRPVSVAEERLAEMRLDKTTISYLYHATYTGLPRRHTWSLALTMGIVWEERADAGLAPYVITARGRDSFGPAGGTGWGGIEVQPSIPNSQRRHRTQTLYCWHILHTCISSSDPAHSVGALGRPQTKHPGSERGQPRLATTAAKRFQPREVLMYMPTRR